MGLMVHSRTRKKSLIEELNEYGLVYLTNAFLKYKIVLLTSYANCTMFKDLYAHQDCKKTYLECQQLTTSIIILHLVLQKILFMILALVFFSFKLIRMIHSNLNCQKPPAITTFHQVRRPITQI